MRYGIAVGLLIAGCVGALTAAAHAQGAKTPPPTEAAAYRELIRDYDTLMQRPKVAADSARRLKQRFQAVHTVRLKEGQTVPVDTAPEVRTLDRIIGPPLSPKPDKNAKERAEALRNLVAPAEMPRALTSDPQKDAAVILSRPEFINATPSQREQPPWLKKFFDWLGKEITAFFNSIGKFFEWLFRNRFHSKIPLGGLAAVAEFVRLLLIGLLIVGAVIGVVFLIRRASAAGWLGGKRKGTQGGGGGDDLTAADSEIADPLGTARTLAEAGDFRGAVRLAYIAALHRLSSAGLLTLEKNRTNWEYQRLLRSRSRPAYELLLPMTRLFDRVWYGKQTATRQDFDNVVAVHDQLPEAPHPAADAPTEASAFGGTP